jgi:GTPase
MEKFIDLVEIEIESGRGGDGKIAWRREKYEPMGGPAGGDGGRGGSVYLKATNNINTLIDFRFKHYFKAENGNNGESSRRSGASAKDLIILVPIGTLVKRLEKNGEYRIIADLTDPEQMFLVAKGGKGGKGNQHFATASRQAPHFCEPGENSEKYKLQLELKLIAHIGIIGQPNAGKSTLISRLSACKPKIADYPFTTLIPNLGMMKLYGTKSLIIADIPGLIEGAADGAGLGLTFLRHIERTKALIHLIDGMSEDIWQNYLTIKNELQAYNPEILEKREIIVINKIDLLTEDDIERIKTEFKNKLPDLILVFISAVSGQGLDELKNTINALDEKLNLTETKAVEIESVLETETLKSKTSDFKIEFDEERKVFVVEGLIVEGLMRVTNFSSFDSVNHLFYQLKKINLLDELKNCGIKTGDTVLVGNREMIWSDHADNKLI